MLTARQRPVHVGSRGSALALVLLLGALSTSCGLVPEHPGDDNLVLGFRVSDHKVQVKVPLCGGEALKRVEVWAPGSDTQEEKLLWWGEGPTGTSAANGLIELWSPAGFSKASSSGMPADLPASVDVSVTYAHRNDSAGDLVDIEEAAKHSTPPGQYWTIRGETVSAQMIDEQLPCPTTSE